MVKCPSRLCNFDPPMKEVRLPLIPSFSPAHSSSSLLSSIPPPFLPLAPSSDEEERKDKSNTERKLIRYMVKATVFYSCEKCGHQTRLNN